MVLSLMAMEINGSIILSLANSTRCFTGRLTELFELELSKSMVTGVP